MLKQKYLFIPATVIALMLLTGCSSDENAKTTTSTEKIATLLGTDSNNNGVRDDVEKKIYEKYEKPLHRALLMDGAEQFQKVLTEPSDKAIETQKNIARIIHCKVYLRRMDVEIKSYNFEFIEYLENVTFDTPERVKKYLDYNLALSGGNFASKPNEWSQEECNPETIKALEEIGN